MPESVLRNFQSESRTEAEQIASNPTFLLTRVVEQTPAVVRIGAECCWLRCNDGSMSKALVDTKLATQHRIRDDNEQEKTTILIWGR